MIGVQEMSKFVKDDIFRASDRKSGESGIEGQYAFLRIAASPTGSHISEFYARKLQTVYIAYSIYLFTERCYLLFTF